MTLIVPHPQVLSGLFRVETFLAEIVKTKMSLWGVGVFGRHQFHADEGECPSSCITKDKVKQNELRICEHLLPRQSRIQWGEPCLTTWAPADPPRARTPKKETTPGHSPPQPFWWCWSTCRITFWLVGDIPSLRTCARWIRAGHIHCRLTKAKTHQILADRMWQNGWMLADSIERNLTWEGMNFTLERSLKA